jgi:Flp pilus assembly protein TadG
MIPHLPLRIVGSAPFARVAALWRDSRGAALVEFTILAPFMFSLALGVFEFGRFLYQYQMVVEGLRDGTRYLARLDATDATNQANASNLATTGTIDGSGDLRVDGWEAADVIFSTIDTDNSGGDYRGEDTIHTVEATTTFTYQDLGFLSALGFDGMAVDATHQQREIEE